MRARLGQILLALVIILFGIGLWHGYSRGGQDFRVFDFAARITLEGRWSALYSEGPDRFLYAPGFALLFSPLSLFSQPTTHALWLLLLSTAFFLSMRLLARTYGLIPVCVAILFSMRAIWIDLRYGQVNLLVLSAAVWALFTLIHPRSNRWILFSWMGLGIAAFSKIVPLALLAVPLFVGDRLSLRGRKFSILGAGLGIFVILILPFLFSDGQGISIYREWLSALGRKGFPTDTHNQSFFAFLHRFFSGEDFYSLTLGGVPLNINFITLSASMIQFLWVLFSMVIAALFLRVIYKPHNPADAYSLAIALGFLPAHLIWKSYFLLGIPLLASLVSRRMILPVVLLGGVLTFSSNEFLSPRVAAWVEASSIFLWIHLIVIGCAIYPVRSPRVPQKFSS